MPNTHGPEGCSALYQAIKGFRQVEASLDQKQNQEALGHTTPDKPLRPSNVSSPLLEPETVKQAT